MVNEKYGPEGGRIHTCENHAHLSGFTAIGDTIASGAICEATALLCDNDLSLHVDLGVMKGIIPREEAVYDPDGGEVRNIAIITRVGKPVCFKITGIEHDACGLPYARLSRRLAQKECRERFISTLVPGDILPARVTHLEPFGAFVDIGCGIVSLLSVDCISVSRISHPRDRLRPGMNIMAVIKSVDGETGRICVTHKELLGSWEENASHFAVGQTVAGIVRSVEDYGVFVELTPNLAGLADTHEGQELSVGQNAAVYIKNIIPERMKIKLILIDSYKGESSKAGDMDYFIDTTQIRHIDHWQYSPACCERVIGTAFPA